MVVGYLSVFLIFFSSSCYGYNVDISLFNSMEEVIGFETSYILNAFSPEDLSDAYASRGESFLLSGQLEKAIEDFRKAYDFGTAIDDREEWLSSIFRALFGQALTYGQLNRVDMVVLITNPLRK